jgi:hypothetical protein
MSILMEFKDGLNKLEALSLYPAEERYHCTPVEAVLLASIGVDGIHYCILPTIGKKLEDSPVIVVTPLSDVEVIPVAENIRDFISLVVTLKEAGAIEAAALREKDDFLKYLDEDLQGDSNHERLVKEAVEYCKNEFNIGLMENPYEYIQSIKQRHEDIKYSLL